MSKQPHLLFYCQHAMGMGHLVRSLALAQALSDHFRVVLLNGGLLPTKLKIPERLEIINLSPLGLDNGRLVSRAGVDLEEAKNVRRDLILETFRSLRPDVLVIELFPFGRKKFEFELLPLLEASRNEIEPPLIACSLRDILVSCRRDQEKYEEHVITIANRYFDAVLVHSDPTFASLEESLPSSARLTAAIHYTGFVTPERSQSSQPSAPRGPILISAGGGLYGGQLLRTAIDAHALLGETHNAELKVIAGPFLPDWEWDELRATAACRQGVQMVRSVPDLFEELRHASASISQCGYNTALEILQVGLPALVVPFANGGENEQMKRARRLEHLGAVRVLDQHEMTPERMADEMRALLSFHPQRPLLELNGAQRSAAILDDLIRARRVSTSNRGGMKFRSDRYECMA
jgi:predicted glycosyltransferase